MPSPVARLDHSLEKLLTDFDADGDAFALLKKRSAIVDDNIREACYHHLPSLTALPFALCAVGGYGRRELFPHSDIDLLVVTPGEDQLHALDGQVSEFLRVLWDSGLRLSHSVRTIAECARLNEGNPELYISLLDLRFVAGDESLCRMLSQRLQETTERSGPALVRHLVTLTRQRHQKFNNTVYHLEPNVKETCGGLRDLHLLRWLSQLLPQREVLTEALLELDKPVADPRCRATNASAIGFLFAQRCFLHSRYRRDANLLTFDLQDQSARQLAAHPVAPEDWMRLYFGHARRFFQAAERALDYAETHAISLVSQFRDWRTRLSTADFTVVRERILLRNPVQTLSGPEELLRLFIFAGRHGLPLSWDTVRRVRHAAPGLKQAFVDQPPPWTTWRELLAQPRTSLALDEMNRCGLLSIALPEWQSVDSLVVRDFYHRYTVDEHTLVAIQAIDHLVTGSPHTPSRLRHLVEEEEQLPLLRLALLLHDLGKGLLPGDHVRGSLEAAPAVMDRLHVPSSVQSAVLFLISHHLDLSAIMNGRDLEDPATARALTSSVETQEDLRRLTLLTYADISAVNPTAMTPWRLEQLWRVYLLGTEQLTRELASDRLHGWDASSPWSPQQAQFLEGFPKRYLRTHSPEQIARHMQLGEISRREGVAVEVRPEAGVWLITVLAPDKPGLFAALSGVLAGFGMNILKGEASSNAAGTALDMIRFADPNRTLELNPEEIHRLEWTVECIVRGTLQVTELLKRRRPVRRSASESTVLPFVEFNNSASDYATLIDFTAEDRPGLLYDLASAISANGCNLEVVMIDTEAHKAIDVFYVTCNGRKIDEQTQDRLHVDLLKAAYQRPESDLPATSRRPS